jgi:hypothetical protein
VIAALELPPRAAIVSDVGDTDNPNGLTTENAIGSEVYCPKTTARLALPGPPVRVAGTVAMSCEEFTTLVGSAEPFHCTTESELKKVPLTVRLNEPPPTNADAGLTMVIVIFVPVTYTPVELLGLC